MDQFVHSIPTSVSLPFSALLPFPITFRFARIPPPSCLLPLLKVTSFSPSSSLSPSFLILQEKDVISNIHFKFSYQFRNLPLNSSRFLTPPIEHSVLTLAVTCFLFSKIWTSSWPSTQPGWESLVYPKCGVDMKILTALSLGHGLRLSRDLEKIKGPNKGLSMTPPGYFSFHSWLYHFN